ncbi:MAG: glutathione S-transferase [Rhodobacteraceae bacterium]|nr:MAG: glutathione S-transferase [Paracoccaceae bacterium]
MRLFYAPGTIAVATAITLHEAGLDFEPVLVDFSKGEQTKPDYHKLNPKGRVPALVTNHGTLTETGALLEYAAAIAPQAGLVPSDPLRAAKMREVMYYLASTAHVNHAHKMRGQRWASNESSWADMTAKVAQNMTDCCTHIETCCLAGPFVLGDQISLADPWLFTISTWLTGDGVDLSRFDGLQAFMQEMESRPSVQATRAAGIL